jgi:predicted secreted protein
METEMEMERTDYGSIIQRPDGSYVIEQGGLPYHVPANDFLCADIERYAEKYPDRVTVELPSLPPPLEEVKAAKLAEIAAARWKAETGGVMVESMTIDTSRESQALVTGAALAATLDPDYTCQWKTAGGFVTLTAAAVVAVAQAVRAHVQACFDREAELTVAVEAAETVEEAQAVTWAI